MSVKRKTDNAYFTKVKTKGRSKLFLNEVGKALIEDLAKMMCTDEEIAASMGVSADTLTNDNNFAAFSEYKKRGFEQGKASLRRKQYEVAMAGNITMLVWLGKQYLGQSEKVTLPLNYETFDDLKKLLVGNKVEKE